MNRLPPLALSLLLALPCTTTEGLDAAPDALTDQTVQRFLTRSAPPLTGYVAARRLEARNERFNVAGWLDACTELTPSDGFRYRIIAEGGSGLIRGRVLKKALQAEKEAWAAGETTRSGIGPENYAFQTAAEREGELIKVGLKPLRKSRMLVSGAMFLRDDGDLVRVQGRLANNPSFWTRRVDVTRSYERRAGIRVPVVLESVARIRFAGESIFRMTYDYVSVNGIELDAPKKNCVALPDARERNALPDGDEAKTVIGR